jgi:single-strand DNA-binding protein
MFMAGSYNRIILVGNLTRDPEYRVIQGGSGVTKFSLAINRRSKNGDETMYVDIVAWDKLGDICNTYLKKGMNTLVEGRLAIRSYEDKDGVKRKATEVVIDNMQMLGSRQDNPGAGGSRFNGEGEPVAAVPIRKASSHSDFGDDLPDDGEIPF